MKFTRAVRHNERIPERILMTADTVGGVWTYAIELTKALRPYHVKVFLATMGEPLSDAQRKEAAGVENLSVIESWYKLEWMQNAERDLKKAGNWLLRLGRIIDPDLVHLNNYAHATLPWKEPVAVVCHSCVCSWWKAVKNTPLPESWNAYRDMVKNGLNAAGAVVAVSKSIAEEMQDIHRPDQSIEIIYNGLTHADFRREQKEQFVFAMGRIWDEAKNLQLLSQVAGSITWKVVIAGDSTHPEHKRPRKIPGVHLPGLLSTAEVRDYLARAPIFALPARYEPFGFTALEAALSHCALVLSDIPTLREIWGDAALYASPDHPGQWHEAINALIGNPSLRETLAAKAYARGLQFSSERAAEGYMALYERILNISSPKMLSA